MTVLPESLLGFDRRAWLTALLPGLFFLYWVVWIVYARTIHPLAKVPGPFWPSISRTWLMYRAYAGDLEKAQRVLHQQYGPLLRVAPDEVVCDDPREIPTVYPMTRPLEKTVWYDAWRPAGMKSRPDMFTNRSEKDHAAYQRILGHIYSFTSVIKSEPRLDETGKLFVQRLDEFVDRNEEFDFGLWLEMYCWDNIGAVFFGEQFGFLKDSIDYGGFINAVHRSLPFLHVLAMSPGYIRPFMMTSALAVPKLLKAVLAVNGIKTATERETYEAQARAEEATSKRVDMTALMFGIVRTKGEKQNFGIREIVSENWTAIMAGSDSVSIVLRSIFYYLMKNPDKLDNVRAEVDAAFKDGTISTPVQYSDAIKLPYLCAVVKEAMRIFAPFASPLQRYSPPGGMVLAGTHIAGGMRVGLNPAVVQHNTHVFGEDAARFRPERWLEGSPEQIKLMEKCMMAFGAGTRTCTGKHIAMAELHKITPEILHRYEFKMTHDREWRTQNAAFIFQTGVTCKFKRMQK